MFSTRKSILNQIKSGLKKAAVPKPFPEISAEPQFVGSNKSPAENFAHEFSSLGGKFIYNANQEEAVHQLLLLVENQGWTNIYVQDQYLLELFERLAPSLPIQSEDLGEAEVGISLCECLVARTGGILTSSAQEYGRAVPVYSPIHITFAFANQVVADTKQALNFLKIKYPNGLPSMICLAAGPSRTADIEKTLVVGVHGPKEVFTFLIDGQN